MDQTGSIQTHPTSKMRRAFLISFLLFLFNPHPGLGQPMAWAALKETIRTAFPEVRHLSTDSLAAWLASPSAAPLLLDVRAEAEFAVSHLQNARRIDPDTRNFAFLQDLPLDTPMVTYCSVGYRSSEMAQRLREAGFTNVVNLEGSIFEWANEGRSVYRHDRAVRQVHPYDEIWGFLLKKELRAYTVSPER